MPFSDTSAAGNAQGFFIELWQMWAKYSGLEVEFVVADPNQLNQLSQDSADIHIASLSNEKDKVNRALGPVIYSIGRNSTWRA